MHSMLHQTMMEEPGLPIQKFVLEDKVVRLQYSTRDGWSVWHDGQFVHVGPKFWANLRAFIRARWGSK